MLYYIIPPIVIVISLGALVFFISRKSDAIQKEIRSEKERDLEGAGTVMISKLHLFSLAFLEKLMLRIKLLFLKSYNQFDHWVHSIRDKKEEKQEQIETNEEAREEAEQLAEAQREKLTMPSVQPQEKVMDIPVANPAVPESLRRMPASKVVEEIKVAAPMVSKRATQPEARKKNKSQLEEALIERIALNPRDIEAYERLGDYYLEEKNNEDALECFRQVLKLSPGNHKARLRLKKLEKLVLGW
jgi:tetratricopeptide (TPR) repeat protein